LVVCRGVQGPQAVHGWLQSCTVARILHVFDHVVNLVDGEGRVLSLVERVEDLGPFALLIENPGPFSLGQLVGEHGQVTLEGVLRIGELAVDWQGMELWNAQPDWDTLRKERDAFLHALPVVQEQLAWRRKQVDTDSHPPSAVREMPDGAQQINASRTAWDLVHGSSRRKEELLNRLLGAGQGLTPAGDDFLLGVLLAGHLFLPGAQRSKLRADLLRQLPGRTTLLSNAWLRAAAEGECAMAWHRLFEAVVESAEPDIRKAVQELMQLGCTSGIAGMAGFLTGLEAYTREA